MVHRATSIFQVRRQKTDVHQLSTVCAHCTSNKNQHALTQEDPGWYWCSRNK